MVTPEDIGPMLETTDGPPYLEVTVQIPLDRNTPPPPRERAAFMVRKALDLLIRNSEDMLRLTTYTDPSQAAQTEMPAAGFQCEPLPQFGLTKHETDIVKLMALGHTNKTIGAELNMPVNTVRSHLRRLSGKLGVQVGRRALIVSTVFGIFIPTTGEHGRAATDDTQ